VEPRRRYRAIYVGRVAVEKNIGAFLKLKLPGTKIVVGDGPQLSMLRRRYRKVVFTGNLTGEDLARHYAAADVFVFPSRTDTFGNVILEALASGVPVAAYPVAGPLDVMGDAPVGCLDTDLSAAVRRALTVSPAICRAYAEKFSWRESALQFIGNLTPVTPQASMLASMSAALPVPPARAVRE
jgi:glycosyltransferase involved in cell wall biosynthesis